MSEVTEAYESGKAVGRCQGARDMEMAIALDNKEASLRIAQQTKAGSAIAPAQIAAIVQRADALLLVSNPSYILNQTLGALRQLLPS